MDTLVLSRMQFALNISFHILFPVISIALAWVMVFFRVRYTLSHNPAWQVAYHRAIKWFALTFALGVVSGVTMSFQFGTNWPGFMEKVGDIAGPLLGYEVMTAFFLEASFLGIMLYGKERVSNKVHIFASVMVAVGTSMSAFWILALNSWMQTPVGFEVLPNGKIIATDWWAIVFNPSFPYRLAHKMLASFVTVGFLLAGLSAWRFLAGRGDAAAGLILRTGLSIAALVLPLQILVGDMHGLNTLQHQPAKVAAMEGLWHTQKSVPLVLLGVPDAATQSNRYAIEVPQVSSLILTHKWDGEVKGLNEFADKPNVSMVFYSFRVMVGMGFLMLAVAWFAAFYRRKRPDFATWPRGLLRTLQLMTFSGWVATLAGWFVTETGRQPWIVYGVLRTADVVAPHPTGMVASSFVMYALVYVGLLVAYISVMRYLALKDEH
ncbi:MAG: cytochrome ubiquinol oxidase subunit I [Formosimonas sp.]